MAILLYISNVVKMYVNTFLGINERGNKLNNEITCVCARARECEIVRLLRYCVCVKRFGFSSWWFVAREREMKTY